MRVVFAPEARDEFVEAERYYDEQLPGLARLFRDEVRSALEQGNAAHIGTGDPHHWPGAKAQSRRQPLRIA